jgi:hypothetical protein
VGGDLGRRIAHGVAQADGARSQPLGCGSRQPIGQISEKGGAKDDAVGYDAGKKVKGRKIHIHILVDSEGPPMGSLSTPPLFRTATGRDWSSIRYTGASLGSN